MWERLQSAFEHPLVAFTGGLIVVCAAFGLLLGGTFFLWPLFAWLASVTP
jgi:hypothetical protein